VSGLADLIVNGPRYGPGITGMDRMVNNEVNGHSGPFWSFWSLPLIIVGQSLSRMSRMDILDIPDPGMAQLLANSTVP